MKKGSTMNKIEKQKNHFNSISQKYFQARQSRNHLLFKELLWNYFFKLGIFEEFRSKKITVLEPMCGYAEGGKIIKKGLNPNIDYQGFDISENILKEVKLENKDFKVFLNDVSNFNLKENFDIIIIIGGLHHVPHITKEVLDNINNHLSKDGIFINIEPTHNLWFFKKIRSIIYNKNDLFDEETEEAFDLKDLNNMYLNSSLEISTQIHFGLFAYILYYNPDAFPFLNIGGEFVVKTLFKLESLLYKSFIGKKFSFATFSVLIKK